MNDRIDVSFLIQHVNLEDVCAFLAALDAVRGIEATDVYSPSSGEKPTVRPMRPTRRVLELVLEEAA